MQIKSQLEHVDGVMVGRAAYQNPFMLVEADKLLYEDDSPLPTREEILGEFKDYAVEQIDSGLNIKSLTRHIIGLYQGQAGARQYRRMLSDAMPKDINAIQFLDKVIHSVSRRPS